MRKAFIKTQELHSNRAARNLKKAERVAFNKAQEVNNV